MTPLKQLSIFGLETIPEIKPGDDISAFILASCEKEKIRLETNDVIVITSKIVSKAENNLIDLEKIVPSRRARAIAKLTGKEPVEVEIILSQSTKISAVIPVEKVMRHYPEIFYNLSIDEEVASRTVHKVPSMLLTLTKQGIPATDAGLDYSNNPPGIASLLPSDPNSAAKRIRDRLCKDSGKDVAVVISDTEISFANIYGSTEVAIGYSGIRPVARLFGSKDRFGREKFGGADIIVDELANSAALLEGQTSEGIPVVIIRGLQYEKADDHLSFPTDAREKGLKWTILATLKLRLFARVAELLI
jgi:coenzyme F420-0:L-glutamate ligase / coenzyme F420-1:gamma-L-glutamate ligase